MILLLSCPYALPAMRDLIIPLVCSVVEAELWLHMVIIVRVCCGASSSILPPWSRNTLTLFFFGRIVCHGRGRGITSIG